MAALSANRAIPYPAGAPPPFAIGAQVHLWQGQFPPPEAIERYEKSHPGAFGRMIAMAEFSQKTQAEDTRRAQHYAHADTRTGQLLGAAATALAMVFSMASVVVGAYTGKQSAFGVAVVLSALP